MKDTDFKDFEEPIRSEIFSASRLEIHAQSLAKAQIITTDRKQEKDLAPRVRENRKLLEKSYQILLGAVQEKSAITPAAEWLIDNFHIVRAQIKDIHDHLPPRFYRELPKIAEGPLAGFPRVYGIAWAFVAHTESRFDPHLLKVFLKAYQKVQPLTIGELWAVSITLRVVLIENLRRLSVRIVGSQIKRKEADEIANELLGLGEKNARPFQEILHSLEKRKTVENGFAVQLLQRLRFQDPQLDPVLQWLEKRLAERSLTPDEVVSTEHNSQLSANATVRNIITSSRHMLGFNWQDLFEEVSLVDSALRTRSGYAEMDFATRNRYRKSIEDLAKHSNLSELEITEKIIKKTDHDPGYYLLSSGRTEIEEEIQFKSTLINSLLNFYKQNAISLYLGSAFFLTAAILTALSLDLSSLSPYWILLVLLGFFPASEIALALINRLTIAMLGPRHLPRFSFEKGLPETARTFVVVPTMFTSEHKVEDQLEQIEIHYLSNSEDNMYFALLTDWLDSDTELSPRDQHILDMASQKLARLNEKYPSDKEGQPKFYIFHRKRLFNPQEGKWMGWERKRGKLQEFNQLLRGESKTTFIPLDQKPLVVPRDIRYVITLDADTRLPNGSALQLIGTMAHPLNRPRYDRDLGRVVEGYGILQPRITPTLPSAKDSTPFQELSTEDAGIDLYASAVSDVYQDLFGEGSFTGKGIYDVEVFENALKGRIPENSLLSHDLFEGNYARCGFLSDVEFFEDFPSHTEVAVSRSHRWTRGDWQLLPWILGRGGKSISALGRWKMIDNLRRSLVAPASFFLLVATFAIPELACTGWVVMTLISFGISTIMALLAEMLTLFGKVSIQQTLWSAAHDFKSGFWRFVLFLALLPHHAWQAMDAVSKAVFRLTISRKKLLEWTTAAQVQSSAKLSWGYFLYAYKSDFLLILAAMALVSTLNPEIMLYTSPLWLLWVLSPMVARHASSPPKPKLIKPLDFQDIQLLHASARKIWHFFTTFVTDVDHHLPPDNFQETPHPEVAHRSSPTNFGLYLLSALSARDMGWIGTFELSDRLTKTLKSLEALPRYQGHFYNWYETRERRALDPKYISSVDNGNLAGHLLAVEQGCLEMLNAPLPFNHYAKSLLKTLLLLEDTLADLPKDENLRHLLKTFKLDVIKFDQRVPVRLSRWTTVTKGAEEILELVRAIEKGSQNPQSKVALLWAQNLLNDTLSASRDLSLLFAAGDLAQVSFSNSEPMQNEWVDLQARIDQVIPVKDWDVHLAAIVEDIILFKKAVSGEFSSQLSQINKVQSCLEENIIHIRRLQGELEEAAQICYRLFHEMDFRLLYDSSRKLFSIGYRVAEKELDASFYDLLASEARLTSFIAIAKGDIAPTHWFHLGRGLAYVKNGAALVSWSGSMFEYLMPALVMQSPEGSIVDKTCQLVVQRQIQYGSEKNIPWGLSESAYNKRDVHLTYQYSNFGIPDLGLKRGLGADLVVAPYATILGSMYETLAAVRNLRKLQDLGGEGLYGFYEAIDFTPSRLPEGQTAAVVKAYMAHHQGMSLVSINNVLKNGIMRDRFHAHPLVQSAELLLQERMPRNIGFSKPPPEKSLQIDYVKEEVASLPRQYHSVNRPVPTTHLLSNGDYSIMLTSSGSGYSKYRDTAINRWREDVTKDNWGSYIYLKDCDSQRVWSAAYQPTCVEPDKYDVTFFEDRARFHREDQSIECALEILLSPENAAEIRRLSLTNHDDVERTIEVTSYFEVVLNQQNADVAHPAFSNLFVQTEYLAGLNTLLATRRPRSAKEHPLWCAHVMSPDKFASKETEYETNRAHFLGLGRDNRKPQALFNQQKLSNTTGAVLDPVMSLRTKVTLPPGSTSHITFSTMASHTREDVIELAEKFLDSNTFTRITDMAWTQAQVKLHYFNMEPDEAHLFQRLATRLLYLDTSLRPSGEILKRNHKNVTGLWAYGVSGDLPIILVRIDNFEDRGIIRQLLKAHDYLGSKGMNLDLVILNDQPSSYALELQAALEALVHSGSVASHTHAQNHPHTRGKIYVLRADIMPEEDRHLLYASARVVLSSRQGSLSEQVKRMRFHSDPYSFSADKTPAKHANHGPDLKVPELEFFNGLGGFTKDGREYVTVLNKTATTPAPWINVIANSQFGFQVSESGSGYTWAKNSRENQITPWKNDPVCDSSGEAFYILDKDNGSLWSPTALPIRVENATYIAHHGQGYSTFEHQSHGIYSKLTQFVPWEMPVKISTLQLENHADLARELTVCSFAEWVLGFSRGTMAPTTLTEVDELTGAIFAWNPRSDEYGTCISFAVLREGASSYTADRTEFIGRNGSLEAPGSLYKDSFSRKVGGGLDPCAALQKSLVLNSKEKTEVSFFLGQASSREHAREMIQKLRESDLDALFENVKTNWDQILTKLEIETPDASMNLMLNRWLLYQTTACRFWARAAFYQAGGAYGFRDQLQDIMALTSSQPQVAREHILRASSRQFVEGDVQHWWHPPFGRGVRTHFSDDLVWLPYTVSYYLKSTRDLSILDVDVPFLEGPLLRDDQEDSYYTPKVSHNSLSLYEHCVRALNKSLKTGAHGLPLIGAGDWNDGMNRVGHAGKGESVWLAWFLFLNLNEFAKIAESRGDQENASRWQDHAKRLQSAIEEKSWDGEWYRRAYFDDGTPIGSASQEECKIDSLSQTWAVISGAANPQRAKQAMQSVEKHLIRPDIGSILLFTPPFDKTPQDPGYIKGYLPGVRENGGQYTHAAVWCVIAYAMMGEGQKATDLFAMLNPINHARTPEEVNTYKVEPYVIAADVYSQAPYTGRGGWTWYTGSCGWMYRSGVEYILGFQVEGDEIVLKPCIPADWPEFTLRYRHGSSHYEIKIKNPKSQPESILSVTLDEKALPNKERIKLIDDGKKHLIEVTLGKMANSAEVLPLPAK